MFRRYFIWKIFVLVNLWLIKISIRENKISECDFVNTFHKYQPLKNKTPVIYWVVSGVITGLFVYIRLRLLSLPLESDEGEYAYAGQLILKGIPPYKEIYSMKFPGVYYFYSFFLILFGDSSNAIRIGSLIVNLCSAFFILKIGELLHNRITGIFAAIGFIALSAAPRFHGLMANTEHFVNLFVIAAAFCFLLWLKKRKTILLFLSGVLSGFACIMKQHGAYFLLVIIVALIIEQITNRQLIFKSIKKHLLVLSGFTLIILSLFFLVWVNGTYQKFIFFTIEYGRSYISYKTFGEEFFNFFFFLAGRIVNNHIMWLLIICGVFSSFKTMGRNISLLIHCWFMISIAAIFPGYYFRPHYYLLMIPVAAIYFGIFFNSLFEWSNQSKNLKRHIAPILFSACLLYYLIGERQVFFSLNPNDAAANMYFGNHIFSEAVTIGNYINKHSKPTDKILVVGSEPEIYFYAQRKSSTGYIYDFPLVENHPLKDSMVNEFRNEILQHFPTFVINTKSHWYDEWFHGWVLNNVLNVNSEYDLKGFCIRNETGDGIFLWINNDSNFAKDKILWEIYKKKEIKI